jgi:hypothetical protein
LKQVSSPSALSSSASRARSSFLVAGILAFATTLAGLPAQAARFANRFVEFETPPGWTCALEQAEWVCQSSDESRKRDAIIVLAAKLKGEGDALPQFLEHLKKPKTYQNPNGKTLQSEPKYTQEKTINEHPWVDSLHNDSEIPGFVTRYLATVKEDIAVLVTYSIVKNRYQEYLADFEGMIKTLRVFRQAGGLNSSEESGKTGSGGISAGISEGTVFPNLGSIPENTESSGEKSKNSSPEEFPWIPIGAGVAAVLFVAWQRRRQGGG